MTARTKLGGELALLLVLSTLWGASFTLIKTGVATIAPLTLIAARTLIAGAILLAVMRARGTDLPRSRRVWSRLLVQACLNSVVPFTLIAWAEQTIGAGLATILNSTSPVFAFLLSAALARDGGATRLKLFGVVAGLSGTCLIIGVDALDGLGRDTAAQIAVVVASACYGAAAVFGRGFRDFDPIVPATGSMLAGAVLLLPAAMVVDRPWTLAPSAASVLALIALAIFSTALAFTIYFRLIRTLGAVGTTAQAYLRVPIGVAIGVVFLGETLSATAWLGLGLIVAGVIAMTAPVRVQADVWGAKAVDRGATNK